MITQKLVCNVRAVAVLDSWLTAAKIPHAVSQTPGHDFTVQMAMGEPLEVAVSFPGAPMPPSPKALVVASEELLDLNPAKAIAAFHKVTEAAGHGKPVPVSRGRMHGKKESYGDFNLVVMRHHEFAQAPDLSPETYKMYEPIIASVCAKIFRSHRSLLYRVGIELDDLKQYAMIWTTNFMHKYRLVKHEQQNGGLLTAHLRQRFYNLLTAAEKKSRNCVPDLDTVAVALDLDGPCLGKSASAIHRDMDFGPEFNQSDAAWPVNDDAPETDYPYLKRTRKLDMSSIAKRRSSAAKMLADGLAAMSHNEMVQTLQDAADSTFLDPAARKLAAKRLSVHKAACAECSGLTKVDKNVSGVDSGGSKE